MSLYWSDKNIDNHSVTGYLKVRNAGIPWQMKTELDSASEVKEEAKISFYLILQIFFHEIMEIWEVDFF